MKHVFSKMAPVLVLIAALTFLISGTASAHSVATTSTLTHSVAAACPPTIERGSTGTWVSVLQDDLRVYYNDKYYPNSPYNFHPPLAVDGIFGPNTENAVKDWQTLYAHPVDGIVGPITWKSLGEC